MKVAGQIFRVSVMLVAVASLAACDTAPPLPLYVEPPGLTPDNAATLMGNRVERFVLSPDDRVFIVGVDSHTTGYVPDDYAKPLHLLPGSHVVDIALLQGKKSGHVATEVQLEAGKTYVTTCRAGLMAFTVPCVITEQQSKTKVAEVLMRLDDGSIIPILIRGGKKPIASATFSNLAERARLVPAFLDVG